MTEEERQAASWRRAQQVLESSGEALRRSREREIPDPDQMWKLPVEERSPEYPPPAPRRRQQPVAPRDWAAEHRWIEGIIASKTSALAVMLADEFGRALAAEREARTVSEAATVELMLGLEARIAELEAQQERIQQPSSRPRLVGGSSDAA